MKTTITTTGQYGPSNAIIFEGSKKQARTFLRNEARRLRRESRVSRHLPDNVYEIDNNQHNSRLVTMASFDLNSMSIDSLLKLMNSHGVIRYTVA